MHQLRILPLQFFSPFPSITDSSIHVNRSGLTVFIRLPSLSLGFPCADRDSVVNKIMVASFVIVSAALLVIGCMRNQVPLFRHIIARANEKNQ